jgi:transcriptional regulator with XRE-family HTH domain
MLNNKYSILHRMKTSGERIRHARKSKGLTQEALGAASGVTKSSVSQWEGDLTTPTADNYLSIADETGFSYRWLVRGDGPEVVTQSLPFDIEAYLKTCELSEIKNILLSATQRLND